jgi:hypothetical protein
LRGGLERIEAGAAAEGLVEGDTEVAEAVVTHFECSFRHVALAGTQQISGALHADLTDVLLDGQSYLLGEKAAQVKRAATHESAQFLQRRRFAESFAQEGARSLDTFSRGPLLPGTEKFAVR